VTTAVKHRTDDEWVAAIGIIYHDPAEVLREAIAVDMGAGHSKGTIEIDWCSPELPADDEFPVCSIEIPWPSKRDWPGVNAEVSLVSVTSRRARRQVTPRRWVEWWECKAVFGWEVYDGRD